MNKIFVFVCVLLIIELCSAAVQPRDLISEANEQLERLRQLVEGDIFVADEQLNNLGTDFIAYANNVASEGALTIQEDHGTIISQIDTLKELANGAGKDVTPCTDTSEELLDRLPAEYTETLVNCARAKTNDSTKLLRNVQNTLDGYINKILYYQIQLGGCENSVTCIQPIVREIQLDMIRLPAFIKTEVNAVESQLSIFKLAVDQCSDTEVTSYVSKANAILTDITTCINRILDRP